MAFPDEPCPQCPRLARGLSLPCRAQTTKHARYCELVAMGHAGYIASLCKGDAPTVTRPAPTDLIPVAESKRRLAAVRACAWRTLDPSCGCEGLATCALSKGRAGSVSLTDCLACVADET